jgi:DNA-directed RNA polymerase specialized sigma24 family protein
MVAESGATALPGAGLRLASGSERSGADIARVYAAAWRAVVRFRQLDGSVQEDLVQETLARWLVSDGVHNPRAWVQRVARHLAIDHLRATRKFADEGVEFAPFECDHVSRIDGARALRLAARAPAKLRETLLLLFARGYEVDDLVERSRPADDSDVLRGRRRDLCYKRRKRGLAWVRRQLLSSAA